MTASRLEESTLRPAEPMLAWAIIASAAAHLILYAVLLLGQQRGWWTKDLMPAWLKSTKQQIVEIKKAQAQQALQPAREQEPPLLFVEVDPEAITPDAPKKATHYSSQNSKAANPDLTIDTQKPKIDGAQTHVPKTTTTPKSKPVPLQPAAPKQPPVEEKAETEAKPKPKGGPKVGDLAMAKPAPQPGEGQVDNATGNAATLTPTPTPARKRPHNLAEAQVQQSIAGEKMKQDGGVTRKLRISSLDAMATPFGAYDAALIAAIKARWDDLLMSRDFSRDRTGTVVVFFNLNYDGRVTDVKVLESNVGDVLSYVCQRAILDPAPYLPWPSDMRRLMGGDTREVTFTFFYE